MNLEEPLVCSVLAGHLALHYPEMLLISLLGSPAARATRYSTLAWHRCFKGNTLESACPETGDRQRMWSYDSRTVCQLTY